MLMEETSCHIVLVGARDQVSGLSNLCQQHDGSERIVNLGGRIDWSSLAAGGAPRRPRNRKQFGGGAFGGRLRPTDVAIYSGSHQPQEWGPRGDHVHAVDSGGPVLALRL
jgi:hypothetical protein